MIRTGYNGGQIWWCDQCDVRQEHNHHVVEWTAGRAPRYCSKCVTAVEVAWDVAYAIRQHLRCEPEWNVASILRWIQELKLPTSRYSAHQVAAVLSQIVARHEQGVVPCNH